MSSNDYLSIRESDLPRVISSQIEKLNELEKSVNTAIQRADDAKQSAQNAYNNDVGIIFGHKEAIEGLQISGQDQAKALVSLSESQKLSFENQKKLAEITKYLFSLGVSNIAMNRSVVRELELKLKGASGTKLTALAREEMLSVVRQLKAQEDILKKQANLEEKTRDHAKLFDKQKQHDGYQERRINAAHTALDEHKQTLEKLESSDSSQKEQLAEHTRLLHANAAESRVLSETLSAHDQALDEIVQVVTRQDETLAEHERLLQMNAAEDRTKSERLTALDQSLCEITQMAAQWEAKLAEHQETLTVSAEQDRTRDELLSEHTHMLSLAAKKEQEQETDILIHQRLLDQMLDAQRIYAEELARYMEQCCTQSERLNEQEKQIKALHDALEQSRRETSEKLPKAVGWVTAAFAAAGLIFSIISLFM